jgi:hypothetical protein
MSKPNKDKKGRKAGDVGDEESGKAVALKAAAAPAPKPREIYKPPCDYLSICGNYVKELQEAFSQTEPPSPSMQARLEELGDLDQRPSACRSLFALFCARWQMKIRGGIGEAMKERGARAALKVLAPFCSPCTPKPYSLTMLATYAQLQREFKLDAAIVACLQPWLKQELLSDAHLQSHHADFLDPAEEVIDTNRQAWEAWERLPAGESKVERLQNMAKQLLHAHQACNKNCLGPQITPVEAGVYEVCGGGWARG